MLIENLTIPQVIDGHYVEQQEQGKLKWKVIYTFIHAFYMHLLQESVFIFNSAHLIPEST